MAGALSTCLCLSGDVVGQRDRYASLALGAALEKAREDLTKEKMTHQLAGNQLLKSRSMEWQALEALEEETRVRQAMEAAILVLDKWLHQCLVQLAARGGRAESYEAFRERLGRRKQALYVDHEDGSDIDIAGILGRITVAAKLSGIHLAL